MAVEANDTRLRDPRWFQAIFSGTEYAWLWLIARVYLGWLWVDAGWAKIQSDSWMNGGVALKGAWERMIAPPAEGRASPVVYDWYRAAIQGMYDREWWTWFGPTVAVAEWLVGIALIVGALTGIAALVGGFMNWNFAMAGMGAASNAVMIVIAMGIILAWKTAGWWGFDRWLLPVFGTPWQPGYLFSRRRVQPGGPTRRSWVQFSLMVLWTALAIYALANLSGVLQIVVLLLAAALVAATGVVRTPALFARLRVPIVRRG